MISTRFIIVLLGLVAFGAIQIPDQAHAAPVISNVSVRGLQIGATTKITIQGSDLIPAPRLVTSVPIAKQVVVGKPAANRVEFEVTLDNNVTPGIFNLRLASEKGISPSIVVAIDRLPQIALAEKLTTLPVAVHGTLTGSNVAKTTFTATKDQQIVIDVEAQRLGGKLRPVIHLLDPQRREIAWAHPNRTLSGDARITAKLPVAGEYSIELHDLQYAVPAPNHFRMKVGTFQYSDLVFPPAAQSGKQANVQLLGNAADPPFLLVVTSTGKVGDQVPVPWSSLPTATGLRPKLLITGHPELVETRTSPDAIQQLSAIPVAVSGRLDVASQVDKYAIPVTEGTKIRFEIFADRIGSPIDTQLELKNEKGARLAINDDFTNTTDSRIDYTVAKGVKVVHAEIIDQVGHANAHSIYRLAITPINDTAKQGNFTLTMTSDTQNVPQRGERLLTVIAKRENYTGPIKISIKNLPAGFKVTAADIPADSNATLITITGTDSVGASAITTVRGTSVGLTPAITKLAAFDKHPLGKSQPWLRNDIAFALTPPNVAAFRIDWSKPAADTPLALGTTFRSPIKLIRPEGAIGPVRLSVVVSEPIPVINNRPDVNRAVRAERATLDIPIDPTAKATFDALNAANKVLATATTKAQVTRAAQAKLLTPVATVLKTASGQQAQAVAAVETTLARIKPAETAKSTAQLAVTKSQAAVAVASDEAVKVAATTKLNAAMQQLASTQKTLSEIAAQIEAAKKNVGTSTAAVAAATTKLQTVQATANKLIAADVALLKGAQTKQLAATKAFQTAKLKVKNEALFNVIVPPNFISKSCDLAIKAEFRSFDNRVVLAEVYTPVRRFKPLNPLVLKLAEANLVTQLDAKSGATVKIKGTIERLAGFNGDITVSIVGQPGGVVVPKVVVKPDTSQFELELKFPANFKPAEVKTIKVFATGPANKAKANVVVRTEVPISINVQAPAPIPKPAPAK